MAAMTITSDTRLYRATLTLAALVAILATGAIGLSSESWIGTSFPGFFILANRVIPSIGLTGWSGTRDGVVYQRVVVAMDGRPINSAGEVYARVAANPPGRAFTYTLRHGSATETVTLPSHRFSNVDYSAIFGAYLVNGFLYLALGLLGGWLFPENDLGRALLYCGSVAGIYALSAIGLYGPEPAIRIHALAEAFFPATLIYLAVVFPRDRGWLTAPLTAAGWGLSLALAIPYQLLLAQPGAYSTLHAACETYLGIAGIALAGSLLIERCRTGAAASPLLRAGLAGALLGLGVPAIVMILSGVTGGGLPVNVAAATAFLFPACCGWGVLRERLTSPRVTLAMSER
jgi:hypothetical protein